MTLPNRRGYKTEQDRTSTKCMLIDHPLYRIVLKCRSAFEQFPQLINWPTSEEIGTLLELSSLPQHIELTEMLLKWIEYHLFLIQRLETIRIRTESILNQIRTHLSTKPTSGRRRLSREANGYLTAWFVTHIHHPYPNPKEREELAKETQLNDIQIKNWFANMRKRHWKPSQESRSSRNLLDAVLHKQWTKKQQKTGR